MKNTLLLTTLWLFALSANAQCRRYIATSRDQSGNATFAIASNGTLWAFGQNTKGQLDDGTTSNRTLPVDVGTDNDRVYLSAASRHFFGIKADGTLRSWGKNNTYALGDGTNVNQVVPK